MFSYLLTVIHFCPVTWAPIQLPDLPDIRDKVVQASCDLSFGNKQVEQFICDRPDAGEIIKGDNVLRMMLIWYFAGELKGERVYWDYREPTGGGQPADHLPKYWGYPAFIRVSNKQDISAIDKCSMLMFELFNSEVDKEVELLSVALPADRKSRDEFAVACVKAEFRAGEKTKAYFLQHPIAAANLQNDPAYCSRVSSRMSFSDYLAYLGTLDNKTYNPIKYYQAGYDRRLPYLDRRTEDP